MSFVGCTFVSTAVGVLLLSGGLVATRAAEVPGPAVRIVDRAACRTVKNVATDLTLKQWPNCPDSSRLSFEGFEWRLCTPGTDRIDRATFQRVRNLELKNAVDADLLCALDTAIVQSLQECGPTESQSDVTEWALLLFEVAGDWRERGVEPRAEQLYQLAATLLQDASDEGMARLKVLGGWAVFEMERGNLHRANELMDAYLALERKRHDSGRRSTTKLVRALELKSKILEQLGHFDEAAAARKEADTLRESADSCSDWLCGERFNIVCDQDASGKLVCRDESDSD